MHRCGSSTSSHYHNMVGPCSCGCNGSHQPNAAFSVVFSVPTAHKPFDESEVVGQTSSVDCTLSLGTPSTRLLPADGDRRSKNCVTNFCWDLLKPKSSHHSAPPQKDVRGGDTVIARRCTNCDTTSTPLWRNGPKGPKSLCNACGIRFKKEERRATANVTTTAGGGGGGATDAQQQQYVMKNNSRVQNQYDQSHKLPCFSPTIGNELRFAGDNGGNTVVVDGGNSFLSWRLNVTDRPAGLVHDFTR